MSPFAHVTDLDHWGGLGEDVTEDQEGSPERLMALVRSRGSRRCLGT